MLNWLVEHWYLAAAALVIGVATAWWIWGSRAPVSGRPSIPAEPLQPIRPDIVAAEPARFAPPPAATVPEPVAADRPAIAAAVGPPDNLTLLKGVGPKLNGLLAGLGVSRFDQIAAWTAADIAAVDACLGSFAGRIVRDNWVDQAAYLARGDRAGFEAKYGALDGELG